MNDAILPIMNGQLQLWDWIERAKGRGIATLMLTLLDAIEPLAPALAQGLLVAQPLANVWQGADGLRALADLLDEPEGLQQLRRQLSDDRAE